MAIYFKGTLENNSLFFGNKIMSRECLKIIFFYYIVIYIKASEALYLFNGCNVNVLCSDSSRAAVGGWQKDGHLLLVNGLEAYPGTV